MIIYHDNGEHPILREYFTASGVEYMPLWRNHLLRFMYRKMRTHVPKKWVFRVPKPAETDDMIIVFDTHVTPQYLYWLCEHYPDKRIIFWYWNPADDKRIFDLFPRRMEIWSYSPSDCGKYGFRYNTQFYFDCIAGELAEIMKSSAFFCLWDGMVSGKRYGSGGSGSPVWTDSFHRRIRRRAGTALRSAAIM